MLPEDQQQPNQQQPVSQPQQPVVPPNPSFTPGPETPFAGGPKKPNTGLIIGLAVGGAVLVAAIIFAIIFAMNNNSDDGKSAIKQDESKIVDPIDETTEDEDAVLAISEKAIGETITDPEMGFTIKVEKVRFNVPLDSDMTGLAKAKKGVAVEVTATNNTKYSTGFYGTNLKLITNGKTEYASTTAFDEYIEKEGLNKFPSSGVSRGNTTTAWVFFYTDKDNSDMSLRYERRETRIIGGEGGTIPAKNFDVKL